MSDNNIDVETGEVIPITMFGLLQDLLEVLSDIREDQRDLLKRLHDVQDDTAGTLEEIRDDLRDVLNHITKDDQ